jgi:hypothetical protein
MDRFVPLFIETEDSGSDYFINTQLQVIRLRSSYTVHLQANGSLVTYKAALY